MRPVTKILLKCQKVADSCNSYKQASTVLGYLEAAERFLNLDTANYLIGVTSEDSWLLYGIKIKFKHRRYV